MSANASLLQRPAARPRTLAGVGWVRPALAAVMALAAVLAGKAPAGATLGVVVSGGNVDLAVFADILSSGASAGDA